MIHTGGYRRGNRTDGGEHTQKVFSVNDLRTLSSVFLVAASESASDLSCTWCDIIHLQAWGDGKIRAFTPESGKLLYTIHDAHHKGVTAIASTSNSRRIISGGGEGQVRVWDITKSKEYTMVQAMKEHKGRWFSKPSLKHILHLGGICRTEWNFPPLGMRHGEKGKKRKWKQVLDFLAQAENFANRLFVYLFQKS